MQDGPVRRYAAVETPVWAATSADTRFLLLPTRNLMARDELKNLGFAEQQKAPPADKPAEAEKGVKGELRW